MPEAAACFVTTFECHTFSNKNKYIKPRIHRPYQTFSHKIFQLLQLKWKRMSFTTLKPMPFKLTFYLKETVQGK